MYKFSEYGFYISDNKNLLNIVEHNNLASNIRELCFSVASQSSGYSLKQPLAIALEYKEGVFPTVYSDSKMTYFGIYYKDDDKVKTEVDVEFFNPSKKWFLQFASRCDKRILERSRNDNPQATIYSEIIFKAWKERLHLVEKDLPSNVPCCDYEISIEPTPHFIDIQDKEVEDMTWDELEALRSPTMTQDVENKDDPGDSEPEIGDDD